MIRGSHSQHNWLMRYRVKYCGKIFTYPFIIFVLQLKILEHLVKTFNFLYFWISLFLLLFYMLRAAKKYAYENLITRETQFEKPVDEEDEDEEEPEITPNLPANNKGKEKLQ